MIIIVSHDIDNLSAKDHFLKDKIILREISRSFSDFRRKKITLKVLFKRLSGLLRKGFWSNLEEMLKFDKENKVNSTFFIAVSKGKGINYSQKEAQIAINLIKDYGFDVGVHGIYYDNYELIKREYEDFKRLSKLEKFGIRIHHLKLNNKTLSNLARAGYLFDTTVLSSNLDQEYKIDEMTEIPFHVMDVRLLGYHKNLTLEQAKENTIKLLERAERENKKYFSMLLHDRRFSNYFPDFKEWYIWFINYCKERNYQFGNYVDLL